MAQRLAPTSTITPTAASSTLSVGRGARAGLMSACSTRIGSTWFTSPYQPSSKVSAAIVAPIASRTSPSYLVRSFAGRRRQIISQANRPAATVASPMLALDWMKKCRIARTAAG